MIRIEKEAGSHWKRVAGRPESIRDATCTETRARWTAAWTISISTARPELIRRNRRILGGAGGWWFGDTLSKPFHWERGSNPIVEISRYTLAASASMLSLLIPRAVSRIVFFFFVLFRCAHACRFTGQMCTHYCYTHLTPNYDCELSRQTSWIVSEQWGLWCERRNMVHVTNKQTKKILSDIKSRKKFNSSVLY